MAFCYNCGAELPEGAKFCVECGVKVGDITNDVIVNTGANMDDVVPVIPIIPIVSVQDNADKAEDMVDDLDEDDYLGGYAAEPSTKVFQQTPAATSSAVEAAPLIDPAPVVPASKNENPHENEDFDDLDEDDDLEEDDDDLDGDDDQVVRSANVIPVVPTQTKEQPPEDEDDEDDDDIDEDDFDIDPGITRKDDTGYDDYNEDDDLDEDEDGQTLHGAGSAPSMNEWVAKNGGVTPMTDPYWDDILPDLEKEIYEMPKDLIFKIAGSFAFILILVVWLVVML